MASSITDAVQKALDQITGVVKSASNTSSNSSNGAPINGLYLNLNGKSYPVTRYGNQWLYLTEDGKQHYIWNESAIKELEKQYDKVVSSGGSTQAHVGISSNDPSTAEVPDYNSLKVGKTPQYTWESADPNVYIAPEQQKELEYQRLLDEIRNSAGAYKSQYDDLLKRFEEQEARNQELADQLLELTRPKSAQEVADELSIDYNEANILRMMNEDTNTYYDDMVKAQNTARDNYLRNNSQYVNNEVRNYLDSYQYAAPTATGKAAKAANVLATNIAATQDNAYNDTGMLQSVNELESARTKDLAANKNTARDYYTKMGVALANAGATRNYADVLQYQNKSNALAQMDASNRTYAGLLANAAASQYAGLAQAAGTTASSGGYSSNLQNIYNLFLKLNGGNKSKAANATYGSLVGSGY